MPAESRSSEDGDWRAALEGYLPVEGAAASAGRTALALQFELRELIPRTVSRWNGPTSKAVSGKHLNRATEYRLGVRPVTRTERGWARGALTWANIPHYLNRLDLDPDQHRWFCQFAALHRAATPPVAGSDSGWVFLDEFVNPVLWTLLEQARELGIPLVGATAAETVTVAGEARVALDASRDENGVLVRAALSIDEIETPDARAIAAHGLYAVHLAKPRRIVIAPTAHLLSEEELALLDADPVVVPPEGVEEFVAEYLPGLGSRIDLTSVDATVPLPEPLPPQLVVVVTHAPARSLDLAWRWEQRSRGEALPTLADVLPTDFPHDWLPEDDVPGALPRRVTLRGADAAHAVLRVIPSLTGVRVEQHGTAPNYRELLGEPHLAVTTVPSDKRDWFDLGVTVTVDGHLIPFLPLFKAIANGRKRLLLSDGHYLSLGHPAFSALAALIAEARDLVEWETGPRLSRHQTSLWTDFEDLADEAAPAVEWRALLAEAGADAPTPVDPPAGLIAELRPYQRDGLSWLAFLWRHRLGGILADDMGLGKTVQCLALAQQAVEADASISPFLVVAPTSVVSNWVAEAARFTPGLVVREITATQAASKTSIRDAAAGAHLVVTSYALLRLDAPAYQALDWSALILDEAQFVKNPASKVHEAARDLAVPVTIAVTGTPMENSLSDLHALLQLTAPGLFPSARRFAEEFVRPLEDPAAGITSGVGAGSAVATLAGLRERRLATLRRRIRPFMLRRTKELVAPELPPKQEQTLMVELAPEHRELYDLWLQRERQKLFGLLEDLDRNRFIVFRSLTLLRLLALDASLIDEQYSDVPSSKLDAVFEQLRDVVAEGHRALVFSQFTSYLARAAARLEAEGIPFVYLDGSTRRRGEVVEEFRSGAAPVFLISLKAGGFGLNLTDADYVFLLDPWWNPATENQAIDRTHRIGQTRAVMVYRMIAAGTIEEKVMALKERKAALFDAVIDDEALFSSALTADDMRELLS